MGWEMRRGKRVYYRKVREGGRVRSVYCGSGKRGEQAAREDVERRGRAAAATEVAAEVAVEAATITPSPAILVGDVATRGAPLPAPRPAPRPARANLPAARRPPARAREALRAPRLPAA
jgi:hypothetical protein